MKEVQHLYNTITKEINSTSDLILKVNDLYTIMLLLISKAFEVASDDQKNLVIDSIKPMTNKYLEKLMRLITEEELKTIDKNGK